MILMIITIEVEKELLDDSTKMNLIIRTCSI